MIESLSVENFKVLRDVDVPLHPLTVIVGPNASGKSTLLKALEGLALCMARGENHLSAFGDRLREVHSRNAAGPLALGCSGRIQQERFQILLMFDHQGMPLPIDGALGDLRLHGLVLESMAEAAPEPISLCLGVEKLLSPAAHPLGNSFGLASDGTGLSWVLAGLYLEHPAHFRDLVQRLKSIVPVVQDIRIRQSRTDLGLQYELIFDMKGADSVPAHAVSEGTLLTLGLLTAIGSPGKPRLVLIENLDHGLHPRAMAELIQQLREIQKQNPELQLIGTSHSPYLLDAVRPEEVLLTSLDEDGYTVVKPLTAHPEYDRWKDLMAPGEFWSTVGESWVAQAGKP